MAYNAGNAFITISPDMKSFNDDIKAKLKADPPKATVNVDADTAAARAQIDEAAKTRTAKVKVDVDKSALKDLVKLQNPFAGISPLAGAGIAGGLALGPQALAAAAGIAGIGAAAGTALGGLAAFAAVAKGPVTEALKANQQAAQGNASALLALSPAERQLATDLGAVTSAWSALEKAETPAITSALAPWLSAAVSGMQLLKPVVTDVGTAIGQLGTEADAAIKSPFWTQFSTVFGQTAQIGVKDFGDAIGHVVDGLAHLFVTFAPDIDKLPPLVDKAAASFDKWAKSVTAGGLEDFFSKTFSPANVAALKADLGNVATIVGNIAKAGADLSPTAFSGLSNLLAVAAKLSPGQIEALAALYGAGKAVGGAGNLAKLATGAATLSLPGKKTAATGAEKAPKTSTAGKIGSVAATATVALPIAAAVEQEFPKGPGGEWVNSWAPYEKIFTNDLPMAWSTSYEAFQSNFAGPMTGFFTNVLPGFFTNVIPSDIWSPAYEGFQSYFAGPLTGFFTNVLPGFFTDAGSWLVSAGQSVANGFVSGWNATEGAITGAFTAGKNWVTGAYADAVSWLTSAGNDVATGFVRAWNATQGAITGAFGAAKNWVSAQFSGAVSWLTSAGNDVASGFVRAWDATQGAITSAFGAAKNWVSAQFSGAVSWLTAAGNNVSSGFVRAWDATEGAVTGAAGRAKGWVTSVFSGAAGWLTSAGEAVVRGLANAISGASGLVTSAISSIGNAVKSGLSGLGIPGFASGTPSAPPGWAWVGEKGPELMHLAGGEQVLTHSASLAKAQSMASLASMNVPSVSAAPRLPGVSAPLSAGPLQMQVSWAGTNDQVTNAVVGGLQFHIQANAGGDVQAALGRGQVRIQ